MRILIPSTSPAEVSGGMCRIDRKFHTGMCRYAAVPDWDLACVVRRLPAGEPLMDAVEVPVAELPYQVETVACDASFELEASEAPQVEALVRGADLVYGLGLRTEVFARRHRVRYIAVTEYSLPTQLQMARLDVANPLRQASRQLKTALHFVQTMRTLAASESVHCNGYPTLSEAQRLNSDCLLYLDSRMSKDAVIPLDRVEQRLQSLSRGRPSRLLFSGRYEAVKGALDVIEVGIELVRLGVDFELHLYGKGDQREAMVALVERAAVGDRIRVHDAVPFPQLVEISRGFDVFVCCHLQGDPSCTYLESMGAGLPVIGYANQMWQAMARESRAGIAVPVGERVACARATAQLVGDHARLAELTRRARSFAIDHSFEDQFDLRVRHIQNVLARR